MPAHFATDSSRNANKRHPACLRQRQFRLWETDMQDASLGELNRRFLDLSRFRAHLGGRLAQLSAAQRAAAADCPYALFDLRFHDAEHWRLRLSERALWHVADTPPIDEDLAQFVRLVLFYAWYLASTARASALLVLGMPECTAVAFARSTVSRLTDLGVSEAGLLSARWSHCDGYWRALAAAASRPDPAQLKRVQLYGIQLAAAAQLPLRPKPREV
jgi:hypothetical protein